jgi:phosphoribosylaminoimidazole-succinocarboxamide synthase
MLTVELKETDMRQAGSLGSAFFPELPGYYRGKVRDNYSIGGERLMIATDRVSSFDHVLPDLIPRKGAVLNLLSAFFFEKTADIVPSHFIEVIHSHAMVVREVTPIPLEIIVRRYVTGSAWAAYSRGIRTLCGAPIPDGLSRDDRLDKAIVTPTLKVQEGHDQEITPEEIVSRGIVSRERYLEIERAALSLFARGEEMAYNRGLVLVDSKYEFGLHGTKLMVIDEIHTPDSSRYWDDADYRASKSAGSAPGDISKEKVRSYLRGQGFEGQHGKAIPSLPDDLVDEVSKIYEGLFERLTGGPLPLCDEIPAASLLAALKRRGLIKGGLVPVMMGSEKDRPFAERLLSSLESLGIPSRLHVASAHKETRSVLELLEGYEKSLEPLVFVTIAGRSNALSGVVAANTRFPVLACPPFADRTDYLINIHSTMQMPSQVPVLAILEPENAALACARILSLTGGFGKRGERP